MTSPAVHWPRRTARLTLRPVRDEDVDALLGYRNTPDVYRWLMRTEVDPQRFREAWLSSAADEWDHSCAALAGDTLIGTGMLEVVDGTRRHGRPAERPKGLFCGHVSHSAPEGSSGTSMTGRRLHYRSSAEIRGSRRRRPHSCWDHLIAAPLWPKYGVNLGTLLRTCDAVGACIAVPRRRWIKEALAQGNTLGHAGCVHWVGEDEVDWLDRQRATGSRLVGVELTDESIMLGDLPAARCRTVMVLGHERTGIPPAALELLDDAVEIPMVGTGLSLNVTVAGSLVLYRLAGLI